MIPSKRSQSHSGVNKKLKANGNNGDEDDTSADSSIKEIGNSDSANIDDNSTEKNEKQSEISSNKEKKYSENFSSEGANPAISTNTVDKDNTKDKNTKLTANLNKNNPNSKKRDSCGDFINNSDIVCYEGHPQNAVEENIALSYEKLILGHDGKIMERPHTKITGFTIYNKQGQLCHIDSSLDDRDIKIYMSGYLKSIGSDSAEIDDESIPVKEVGPILAWYIRSFGGGKKICIVLSTEFAEYTLKNPSEQYKPLMDNLYEKIWLSKIVVEYLMENYYMMPSYEELLETIRGHTIPELNDQRMSEELLHKHANFICDQIVSLNVDEDDEPLITLPCMRELIKLMGIKFGKDKTPKIEFKKVDKKTWTKATTTPLVRKTFESFFPSQLDKTNDEFIFRRKRCGVCEACQLPDCGECNACRDMAKFGGHGRTKKACVSRFCPNMAVEQAEKSDTDDDADFQRMESKRHRYKTVTFPVKVTGANNRRIKWIGEPVKADATKVYYEKVEIEGEELSNGDFVMIETTRPNIPSLVARIVYMWRETIGRRDGYFHGEVFMRASNTVLGEVGDPREVFLSDTCCHGAPLSSILRKACVEKKDIPADWYNLGGIEVKENPVHDDGKTYFYSKYYERFTARFEDLPETPTCPNILRKHRFCPSCERKIRREIKVIPRIFGMLEEKSSIVGANRTEWSLVKWRDYDYKKGCGVFLKPGIFRLQKYLNNVPQKLKHTRNKNKVDEDVYTEYYRKNNNNHLRGSNIDTGEPFCVGYIAAVTAIGEGPLIPPQHIYLKVNVMYRPENTRNKFPQHEDLNVVYWSDEIREIPFSAVTGPCHLIYEKNVPHQEPLHDWLDKDPSRFYFRSAYDKAKERIIKIPSHAANVGRTDQRKDKGKGKGKSSKPAEIPPIVREEKDEKVRPLRTLDVFAGCGGLSEGLHRSGVIECRWAIENDEAAAHAYSLNNENCAVFNEDCNALLRDAIAGATHSSSGMRLPAQGEVELLCGGPPCQGFSGMNRFNSRDYSNFKNSLVASLLSYCDYYRPKYFILENVRHFVAFKRGMVLKLTLRALLDMGYQCTFGVLQAGSYGVPQTRRRLIVLAAAPGCVLPIYPEPTHVFSRRACILTVMIDGKRFATNIRWNKSAPRRTCTVRDAMSDLPQIANSSGCEEIEYGSMPQSHFQRVARSRDGTAKLRDHICKIMAPLVQARICHIPTTPGSDWRDLPNIAVTLSDGTKCKVLQYRYEDKRNGRSSTGKLRGVCACAAGGSCSPQDKQENTLIPWCLPHTANRHNNWAGLYGRISWEGYFSTTVTDPEPMGKQGRVLHPEHPRVVSVRECARSQGFPDHYMLAGSALDKYRQLGNAVPPPLGEAIGRELKKAIIAKERGQSKCTEIINF